MTSGLVSSIMYTWLYGVHTVIIVCGASWCSTADKDVSGSWDSQQPLAETLGVQKTWHHACLDSSNT